MSLRIKKDFSEIKQDLNDPMFVMYLINKHAEEMATVFESWNKIDRRIFKTHFNELIKGIPTLGNDLVTNPATFA